MKNRFMTLVALLILVAVVASSCGTTVYGKRRYRSQKYIGYKRHWFWWHEHHYRPHPHHGGYW